VSWFIKDHTKNWKQQARQSKKTQEKKLCIEGARIACYLSFTISANEIGSTSSFSNHIDFSCKWCQFLSSFNLKTFKFKFFQSLFICLILIFAYYICRSFTTMGQWNLSKLELKIFNFIKDLWNPSSYYKALANET